MFWHLIIDLLEEDNLHDLHKDLSYNRLSDDSIPDAVFGIASLQAG